MSPVVPAPEESPVKRGRPSGNYSVEELCALYGKDGKPLGKSTLYRWAARNLIPSEKRGGVRLFPKYRVNPQLERDGLIPRRA